MSSTEQARPRHLLRFPEVSQRVGISRSEIYRRIQQRRFPAPISLGPQTSAWDSTEIEAWIDEQIAAAKAVAS